MIFTTLRVHTTTTFLINTCHKIPVYFCPGLCTRPSPSIWGGRGSETRLIPAWSLFSVNSCLIKLPLPLSPSPPLPSPSLPSPPFSSLSPFFPPPPIPQIRDYPAHTMHNVVSSAFHYIQKYGVKWVWSFISPKQFFFFLFVYLIPKINVSIIISILATVVFFASFLVMCIATLEVMAHSRKADAITSTFHVFQSFLINTKTMEERLIGRLAVPYLSFLGALLLAVLSIGGAQQQMIFYSLLAVIAGSMAITVFFTFSCWRSPLVLLSVATRVPGWFLVFLYLASTWLPIPEFLFFFGKEIVAIPILPGIYLDFNLITLVQVPLQVVLIAWCLYQQSWHNFYTGIGPYVLFISWWIFCRNLLSHGSLVYFIILIPCVLLFFSLVPFLFMLIPFSPLFIYAYYGLSWQFLVSLFGLVAIGLAVWKVVTSFNWLKEKQWMNIPLKSVMLGQLVVLVVILLAATLSYTRSFAPSKLPLVHMEEYSRYCGPQLWEDHGNSIQTQIKCFHLKGRLLQASARIESVRIKLVTNSNNDNLLDLPDSVRHSLACLMGETKPMCGDAENMTTCVFKGCHFDSGNTYLIQMKASLQLMDNDPQRNFPITLFARISHSQLNGSALVGLTRGTKVQFYAVFEDDMGSELPSFWIKSLTSPSGNYSSSSDIDIEKAGLTIMTELGEGVQRMTNFIMEIVLGYAPSEYYKPKQ